MTNYKKPNKAKEGTGPYKAVPAKARAKPNMQHKNCSKKRTLLKERIRKLESRILGLEARTFELERLEGAVTTSNGVLDPDYALTHRFCPCQLPSEENIITASSAKTTQ